MKRTEIRKPSLSSQQGVDALQARRNQTSDTEKDLLALGIQIDSDVIERLQCLGLKKAWAVASQAATSLKERHVGVAEAIKSPIKYACTVKAEKRPQSPLHISIENEWAAVDHSRICSIYRDLNNHESLIPPNTRADVLRLLKVFRTAYARSGDGFIQQMMGRKSKKEPLEAKHLVNKCRYVDLNSFREIVKRLNSNVLDTQITCMFNLIGEMKQFDSKDAFVLDLWVFLALLKHSTEESRRSFDFKTSRIASDVEFWRNQNKGEKRTADNRRKKSPTRISNRPQSADQTQDVYLRRSVKEKSIGSVAEAFGSPIRPNTAALMQGKHIHGSFSREREMFGTSVPEALNVPKRPDKVVTIRPDSRLEETVVPLGRHKITENFEPNVMGTLMKEGIGVSRAIYGRSLSPTSKQRGPGSLAAMGSMQRESLRSSTSVAEALGSSISDSRPADFDARKKVSKIGKPPYIL